MKVWLKKASGFCAYQERSEDEVRLKLKGWGADDKEIEDVLVWLKDNNFLNEERFAIEYAGGKFRIKKWGKNKIKFELRRRGIDDAYIVNALNEISHEDYLITLRFLFNKKRNEYKELGLIEKQKIINYLLSKGYEYFLINDIVKAIR